ncbi:MAG: iron-sulfur cluster assembly scaffold protein [Nanoarchaeota archaeon]|nr:iron-sulfur cluster assembly scaffold protein [Nanoarchaeota archaeon]
MTDALYREHILDLYKNPRNVGELKGATHRHREFNPLCGDDIEMQVLVKDNQVQDIKFQGHGCALSIAASSLLTEKVKKMTINEIMKLTKDDVVEMMGISMGPVRIKCALLPLETLQKTVMKHAGN